MTRKSWWLVMITVVVAFIAAGQLVAWVTTDTTKQVTQNQDALITVCGTLNTLGFVFQQLRFADAEIARNRDLPRSVRAQVAQRASLYGTAVAALSDTDANCDQVE